MFVALNSTVTVLTPKPARLSATMKIVSIVEVSCMSKTIVSALVVLLKTLERLESCRLLAGNKRFSFVAVIID